MNDQNAPKAFVSCSLRREDKPFVDFIVKVTRHFGFSPGNTPGKFTAAPLPIWMQMNEGIKSADCVVLVATPRYIQQDLLDKEKTGKSMPEMLHTEIGMAVASNRPVLAFVQKGTEVGGFLPQLVQYIVLDPSDPQDMQAKWPLVANYFRSALAIIQQRWYEERKTNSWKGVGGILLIIGAATVLSYLSADYSDKEDEEDGENGWSD